MPTLQMLTRDAISERLRPLSCSAHNSRRPEVSVHLMCAGSRSEPVSNIINSPLQTIKSVDVL